MILAFFHNWGNSFVVMERLIIWVSAGTIVGRMSFITLVSIKSRPKELELPSSLMILSTLSGSTEENLNSQALFLIKLLSLATGSVTGGGRFSLNSSNFFQKIIILSASNFLRFGHKFPIKK